MPRQLLNGILAVLDALVFYVLFSLQPPSKVAVACCCCEEDARINVHFEGKGVSNKTVPLTKEF